MGFFQGKEQIRIPINSKHSALEALRDPSSKRHIIVIIDYTGLKAESE